MKEWSLILIPLGITAILIPAAKWLISDWFKKAKEIEELRQSRTKDALEELDDKVSGLRVEMSTLRTKLIQVQKDLVAAQVEMRQAKSELERVSNESKRDTANMKDYVKQMIKSEIINLTKQIQIVKGGKGGQS